MDIDYFLDKNIKTYSNINYTPFANRLIFTIGDRSFIAKTKQDKNYKVWEVISGEDTIIASFKYEEYNHKWVICFEDDSLIVSFSNIHDPRNLLFEFKEKKYSMINYEPDCNSIFGLHNNKNDKGYYNYENALIYAKAINECDTAKWEINCNKCEKLEYQIISAFCFTSTLAMNVRFIGKPK